MKASAKLAAIFLLVTGLLAAADLNGSWKGQFDFNGNAVPLTFALKADGAALTGTVTGLPAGAAEIKEGKIQGASISFSVDTEYQGNPVKLVYKGQVQDDGIHVNMGTEDGSWAIDFVIKRGS
ncbi:MAG TPA: hypothetical protein VMU19_09120 [Bryobacteraceae bacterium]|nr:hypothetical protein [Bryobacteraceae bacterium]